MNRAVLDLDPSALDRIHGHSLRMLAQVGIRFPCQEALSLFGQRGFRIAGDTVFFKKTDIAAALETAPEAFDIEARNPKNGLHIGGDSYVAAPGYGPPFIIEPSGSIRNATLADAETFCKLLQTSKHLDFNSSIVVHPSDVPQPTAHLDVLLATMTMTDKPLMGSSASATAARDTLAMAAMVVETLDRPVMISLINSLSPFQFAGEMVAALMVYARAGQPLIIHSACTLGSTGPITMAGSLVVSNATTLAGICLAQLIRPGTPVVYGLGGSPVDMRTGGYVNGSPEDVRHTALAAAMGRYYHLPCRGQGALTESFCLDYQAGMESAMMLTTAALSGVNVGLHACGTYGSMLAMSFEKFIADEDLCGAVKRLIRPLELNEDALALDLIEETGFSGNYLTTKHTYKRCRDEFYIPDLANRRIHGKWIASKDRRITDRAGVLLQKRLAAYHKPPLAPGVEQRLKDYVARRKAAG